AGPEPEATALLALDHPGSDEPAADHLPYVVAQILDPGPHRVVLLLAQYLGERRVRDALAVRARIVDLDPAFVDDQPTAEKQLANHGTGQTAVEDHAVDDGLPRVLVVTDQEQLVG